MEIVEFRIKLKDFVKFKPSKTQAFSGEALIDKARVKKLMSLTLKDLEGDLIGSPIRLDLDREITLVGHHREDTCKEWLSIGRYTGEDTLKVKGFRGLTPQEASNIAF